VTVASGSNLANSRLANLLSQYKIHIPMLIRKHLLIYRASSRASAQVGTKESKNAKTFKEAKSLSDDEETWVQGRRAREGKVPYMVRAIP
jgi:hypothetical protein